MRMLNNVAAEVREGIVKPAVGSRLTYPVANLIAYFVSHNPGISAEFTKR